MAAFTAMRLAPGRYVKKGAKLLIEATEELEAMRVPVLGGLNGDELNKRKKEIPARERGLLGGVQGLLTRQLHLREHVRPARHPTARAGPASLRDGAAGRASVLARY